MEGILPKFMGHFGANGGILPRFGGHLAQNLGQFAPAGGAMAPLAPHWISPCNLTSNRGVVIIIIKILALGCQCPLYFRFHKAFMVELSYWSYRKILPSYYGDDPFFVMSKL